MGRASIKGKLRLIANIRKSGILVPVNGLLKNERRLAELKKSLEFYRMWKARQKVKYDELFSQSRFIDSVKYIYVKTARAKPGDPAEKVLDYYDHKAEERLVRENVEYERAHGRSFGWKCRPYAPKGRGKKGVFFEFNCDEKHLSLLRKMERVNKISQQIVTIIDMLKKEIDKCKK